jgi:hypothetical protein
MLKPTNKEEGNKTSPEGKEFTVMSTVTTADQHFFCLALQKLLKALDLLYDR